MGNFRNKQENGKPEEKVSVTHRLNPVLKCQLLSFSIFGQTFTDLTNMELYLNPFCISSKTDWKLLYYDSK